MEERARIRAKLFNFKSKRIRERIQKYKDAKIKEFKKNTSRVKRAFAEQLAKEEEEAANKRDMSAHHNITRRLC